MDFVVLYRDATGTKWQRAELGSLLGDRDVNSGSFWGIAGIVERVWFVGDHGTVLSHGDSGWTLEHGAVGKPTLRGLCLTPSGPVAFGDSATILVRTNKAWSADAEARNSVGDTTSLAGCAVDSRERTWFVTVDGQFYRREKKGAILARVGLPSPAFTHATAPDFPHVRATAFVIDSQDSLVLAIRTVDGGPDGAHAYGALLLLAGASAR